MSSAVVLMVYGSPERLDDVPASDAEIRDGRSIAPEQFDDLVARSRRLGIGESNLPSDEPRVVEVLAAPIPDAFEPVAA